MLAAVAAVVATTAALVWADTSLSGSNHSATPSFTPVPSTRPSPLTRSPQGCSVIASMLPSWKGPLPVPALKPYEADSYSVPGNVTCAWYVEGPAGAEVLALHETLWTMLVDARSQVATRRAKFTDDSDPGGYSGVAYGDTSGAFVFAADHPAEEPSGVGDELLVARERLVAKKTITMAGAYGFLRFKNMTAEISFGGSEYPYAQAREVVLTLFKALVAQES